MSAPKAPDPRATAQAQGAMNKETAIAQAGLNSTDQITPYGTLQYQQNGSWGDGTPHYTAIQQLTGNAKTTNDNMYGAAAALSGNAAQTMSKPLDLSNNTTTDYVYNLGKGQRDKNYASANTSLETDLLNRGVRPGTEAYNDAMTRSQTAHNDSENNWLLNARNQGVNEMTTQYNSPVNQLSALLNGGQVNQTLANTPQTGVNGVDYTGLVNQQYQSKMAGYNGMLGGLGSAAGALGMFAFSDRRLKSGIVRVGTHPLGVGVYEYTIFGERQKGVMSDEVRAVMPEAVRTVGGFDQVDYAAIGGV